MRFLSNLYTIGMPVGMATSIFPGGVRAARRMGIGRRVRGWEGGGG